METHEAIALAVVGIIAAGALWVALRDRARVRSIETANAVLAERLANLQTAVALTSDAIAWHGAMRGAPASPERLLGPHVLDCRCDGRSRDPRCRRLAANMGRLAAQDSAGRDPGRDPIPWAGDDSARQGGVQGATRPTGLSHGMPGHPGAAPDA